MAKRNELTLPQKVAIHKGRVLRSLLSEGWYFSGEQRTFTCTYLRLWHPNGHHMLIKYQDSIVVFQKDGRYIKHEML